jgi:hypothetical protein
MSHHPLCDFLLELPLIKFLPMMGHDFDESLNEVRGGIIQQKQILPVYPKHIRLASS